MKTSATLFLILGICFHAAFFIALAAVLPGQLLKSNSWWIFLLTVLVGSVTEGVLTSRYSNLPEPHSPKKTNFVAQFAGLTILLGFVLAHAEAAYCNTIQSNTLVISRLGILMMLIGFGLRLWSIALIRDDFQTAIVKPKAVVTRGPYRLIRHPAEFGMLLLAVGGTLALSAIYTSVAVTSVLLPLVCWRIGEENRMLDYSTTNQAVEEQASLN